MAGFFRRFLIDPGQAVLLAIESVNVIDLNPPSPIVQVGTNNVEIVGEFENGPFAQSTEVDSTTDVANTFGLLGYTYGSVQSQNPCAVARKADGATSSEPWNGNGFVQLSGKQFSKLTICRVDTSVGSVNFTRNAYVTGSASPGGWQLATGQVLQLLVGTSTTSASASATFTGTAATVTGSGGTFTTATGDTVTLGYDGVPNFTVTFLSTDNSIAGVVARINLTAGFTFASNSGGQLQLTGVQQGTGGNVRVVSGSAGVVAYLGLVAGTTGGGGNVANIGTVQLSEVQVVVQAAVAGTKVEQDSQGRLRISATADAGKNAITVGSATTAANLGFVAGQQGTATGLATTYSTAGTYPTAFGSQPFSFSWDGNPTVTVTFSASQSQAQIIAAINAAAWANGFPTWMNFATSITGTILALMGAQPGGSVTVVSGGTGVLAGLGLAVGTQSGAANPVGVIPAGTIVQVPGSTQFVIMQDVNVIAPIFTPGSNPPNGVGPYAVKVRHARDDGTGLLANAAAITQVTNAPDVGAFAVVNPLPTTNALTETQIDVAYVNAMNATLNPNDVSKTVTVIWSARQSNLIRTNLRQNALTASSGGLQGRMALVRPPLGTSKAVAQGNAAPGVGVYRDQRVVYCFPGIASVVNAIAAVGTAGGQSFTATGLVDQGADGWLASILSNLPPEENPGQDTTFTVLAQSLESAYSNLPATLQLQMQDYINFKASGICAPIFDFDTGIMTFQSGVTSVNPAIFPGFVRISRRRMADFLEDSVEQKGRASVKKLSTDRRRRGYASDVRQFFESLLNRNNPEAQRIAGYTLNTKQRNDPTTVGLGLYYLTWAVKTLSSLDSITHVATIGDTVDVQEIAAQAA